MSWICPMCSTSNADTDKTCIVCDAAMPASSALGFDMQDQMQRLTSVMTRVINASKAAAVDPEQEYKIGCAHLSRKEYEIAFQKLLTAAKMGHIAAQNEVGNCCYYGWGCAQDFSKAIAWFEKAAEGGYHVAQYNLGYCYTYGHGVAIDYAKAYEYYKKAADAGYASAINAMGDCYYYGRYVEKNHRKAVEYFKLAAEKGSAQAQYNLGFCYENGQGVLHSRRKAIAWYEKAVAQGHEGARKALAQLRGGA